MTRYGQAVIFVSLMKLNPFAFIIINTLYIFIHFTIICFIIKTHCQRLLQMQNLHGVFTSFTRRAHNALEDPTALPQRAVKHATCKRQAAAFVLSMLKINATAWRSRRLHIAFPQRFHSVSTALLAFARRAPRRSAIFLNAVGTLKGRHSGVTGV